MRNLNAAITGIGGYVPESILTNEDITKLVDTTDEWITSRTGIKERRILKEKHAGSSYMGTKAVEELLKKTHVDPSEIDALICSTTTGDYILPSTASIIAENCGIKNSFAYDLSAACSGFLFGLVNGATFVESGRYKKVIVVSTEKMSGVTNYTDRTTCPLFGDGAAAVLLEPTTENYGLIDSVLHTDGSGFPHLHIKAGGTAFPATNETIAKHQHAVYQEGQAVFKAAVSRLVEASEEIRDRNNLKVEDITWVVPHQANMRIIDAVMRTMKMPIEQAMINIEKYGNTSSASIPICLWEWEDKLKKGDLLVMSAFGAGFTWGSVLLKWAYTKE
ncbi:MAG: beta-ketoacyl-ACP synthase III [Bacteroidota bacterium]|nr:beta-ketoacyl-ACP synthase III [Bacteroidota bacterium]